MNKVKNIFIVCIIMLFAYSNTNAQKQIENSFLRNIFEPTQFNTTKIMQESENVIEKSKKIDIAIHNINKHLKEAAILRAKGKSEEEINMLFNLQKVVVGTGSISGTVYEDDGITTIKGSCRI